ncbi:hypothetical protein [Cryptosporangium aurantiacum]|uniref:Uncharacterized protein n=1 Tax=Cryptosporangium aurantiacum TaxID=134849 RepID=A0A1M7Q8L0_9ACTN|nr:hypothetical protein [Cryptosporangium aurantiacum]SHN26600.1 hypothetical protein SAMN05443668_104282 [Cryptosporangium aurantiacum]
MNDLLALAVDAHGGLPRWQELSRFRASVSVTGIVQLDAVTVEGETREQRVLLSPFPLPGWYGTWEPHRQTLSTTSGVPTAERREPLVAFAGRTDPSRWDDLQVAYFVALSVWNYLVTPFVLVRSDFLTEEISPWPEEGQTWRRLLVTYPDSVAAHCRQQIYCFDDAGLLRRLDYTMDLLGGGPAVQYPAAYRAFDGIQVPTRRLVHVRNPDGGIDRQAVAVAIEVEAVAWS